MKRLAALILALMMTVTCFGAATATELGAPRASLILAGYNAVIKAGTSRGELRISYDVTASGPANRCGVSSIVIYKSNGSYVTTITGNASNGLTTSGGSHSGTYSYIGTSGVSYYAEVTVFAENSTTSDKQTVTTSTVKAP